MEHLIREIRQTLTEYWQIGDRWTRFPLICILVWPLYLMFVALANESGMSAIAAFVPLLPLTILLVASPVVTGVTWLVDDTQPILRILFSIVGTELLIGLYLVGVPVENVPGLVPVFVLTAITLVLLAAAGNSAPPYAALIKPLLGGLLIIFTIWFYIEPHALKVRVSNPVPWWGFLTVGALAALALRKGFAGWRQYAALAVWAVLMFAGWQALYAGTRITAPAVAMPAVGVTSVRTPTARSFPVDTTFVVVAKEGSPAEIEVPPGYRWDLQDLSITEYTSEGKRDSRGYRIQTFWVQSPVKKVELPIKISKCTTAKICAW